MRVSGFVYTGIVLAGWLTSACGSGKGDHAFRANRLGHATVVGSRFNPASYPAGSGTCDASKAQWAVGERAGHRSAGTCPQRRAGRVCALHSPQPNRSRWNFPLVG